MMKKMIWFIGCFLLFINSSWALTLKCPEVVSPGEVFECQVQEEQYIGIVATYSFADVFSYQSCDLNWKNYYSGREGFSVGNVFSGDKLSLNLKFQVGMDVLVNRDYMIGLSNIEGSTSEYQYVLLDDISSQVRVVSDVNTLDDLKISEGRLSPGFQKNVTSYQAGVSGDSIVIEGFASDSNAKVEGDIGEQKLGCGINLFTIKVTSVRGNVREYHLYVTRTCDQRKDGSTSQNEKSNDITLKKLVINKEEIALSKGVFLYSYLVGNDVLDIEVVATANSKKARVEVQKPEKLVVGENIVRIIVTAEDGTIGTYAVRVDRERELSRDSSIKSLVVKGYELDFEANVYQYTLEIEDEDKLDIQVVLNDSGAKYQIKGNKGLKNNSVIAIEVTAEDGSQSVYEITIVKLNEGNSSSVVSVVKIVPLVGFILLVCGVLVIKRLRRKV